MSLKTYRKSTAYNAINASTAKTIRIQPSRPVYAPKVHRQQVTMWSLMQSFYEGLKHLVASSSTAGLVIPTLLVMVGGMFIYQQFQPLIAQQIKGYAGYYDQGTATLVGDEYIADRLQYVSNPGADYFQKLSKAITQTGADEQSKNYKGTMYLTIPSLGFKRLPIKANVDSGNKDVYNKVLNTALAHFAGTHIPGSSTPGNTVIYGHSVGGRYVPRPDDVLAAFSFLSNLKVGDLIIVERDGKEYKYQMSRSKIVQPEDVAVIVGSSGRDNLTLFTCHPPGNNSQRYVAIATPILE